MIDLRNSEVYTRARYAMSALNDDFIWLSTMNSQQVKQLIIEWITQDQLTQKGIDGEGDGIGVYTQYTQSLNPIKVAGTHYTLYDEGSFYRSFMVNALKKVIVIRADADKMESQSWWRDEILELTDENIQKLRIIYKRKVQDYARDVLLGRR